MRFHETRLPGVHVLEPELHHDERGFFARVYSVEELTSHNLRPEIAQCSISFNPVRGTFRGMHYQAPPYEETKIVRCTRGALYDIVLDLRPQSPTYCQWTGENLTSDNRMMVFIPAGCAHGFITTADDTEVFYQISVCYRAEAARGVRWDDPAFGIRLPLALTVISVRDMQFPDFVQ